MESKHGAGTRDAGQDYGNQAANTALPFETKAIECRAVEREKRK